MKNFSRRSSHGHQFPLIIEHLLYLLKTATTRKQKKNAIKKTCCGNFVIEKYFLCRCVKMALVHDMAECIVGDLTPHDNVSKEEKHRRELVTGSTTVQP